MGECLVVSPGVVLRDPHLGLASGGSKDTFARARRIDSRHSVADAIGGLFPDTIVAIGDPVDEP